MHVARRDCRIGRRCLMADNGRRKTGRLECRPRHFLSRRAGRHRFILQQHVSNLTPCLVGEKLGVVADRIVSGEPRLATTDRLADRRRYVRLGHEEGVWSTGILGKDASTNIFWVPIDIQFGRMEREQVKC